MKVGWRNTKLGDLIDIQNGYAFSSKDYSECGHFLMRIGNVQSGQITLSDPKFVQLPANNGSLQRFALSEGDILVSLTGYVGRVAEVCEEHLPAALNQRVAKITLKPHSQANKKYLLHFLGSDLFINPLVAAGHGAAQQNVSTKDIVAIEMPIPSPNEQHRIVAILDEAFDGIATAKANAEKNLQNARALFESHLQAVFTQRGEGWREKRLAEVSREFGRGKSKHRPRNEPKLYDGPYPFIQTGDISNADHWLTDFTQTYSELGLAQSRLWPKGTICIAIVGATVGETAILNFESCFPDSVIGIVVNEDLADNEYVEFLLQSFKALLKEKGKGTARDNINLGTFENQMFPFPPLNKQRSIVATLNALRVETQRLESIYQQKLTALDELKKSLLHQAFSGAL